LVHFDDAHECVTRCVSQQIARPTRAPRYCGTEVDLVECTTHCCDCLVMLSIRSRCISMVLSAEHQETLMRAGIRLYQPARAASGTFALHCSLPVKVRMSAAAAEPEAGAAAPEPQAPVPPVASASTPVAPTDAPVSSLPDSAAADPVVAGVLQRFIRQYETKDTKEQVILLPKAFKNCLACCFPF
jgi:hypothetical protein